MLTEWLTGEELRTVQSMGWAGISNGELLRKAEGQFDLFLTADKRLRYQQNLQGRRLAILVLPSNRLRVLRAMISDVEAAIGKIVPGQPNQCVGLSLPGQRCASPP
jgi:hypothetical protein